MTKTALRLGTQLLTFAIALTVLAGCSSAPQLIGQWGNPAYAGKPLKSVLVMAITRDDISRRVFEDDMVAEFTQRGIQAVPSYSLFNKVGPIDESKLQEAIARSNAEGVMLARVDRVEKNYTYVPGYLVTTGTGIGWGGFYGAYTGLWNTSFIPPERIPGEKKIIVDSRLFESKTNNLVWAGTTSSPEKGTINDIVAQLIALLVGSMAKDRVI